jgi:hypothetical protein
LRTQCPTVGNEGMVGGNMEADATVKATMHYRRVQLYYRVVQLSSMTRDGCLSYLSVAIGAALIRAEIAKKRSGPVRGSINATSTRPPLAPKTAWLALRFTTTLPNDRDPSRSPTLVVGSISSSCTGGGSVTAWRQRGDSHCDVGPHVMALASVPSASGSSRQNVSPATAPHVALDPRAAPSTQTGAPSSTLATSSDGDGTA